MNKYGKQSYLSPERWVAFQKQVDYVTQQGVRQVLEVGSGSGIVAYALRQMDISVSVLDRDPALKPDYAGDVRAIADIVPHQAFDCILAAQVLEHIPWDDLPTVISGFQSVTRRWCVISVPYAGITFMPMLQWGRHRFHSWRLGGRLPAFWRTSEAYREGEHRWELGIHGHGRRAFRALLSECFQVKAESFHPHFGHMVFYLCERRPHAKD